MSQAHYLRCESPDHDRNDEPPQAVAKIRSPVKIDWLLCKPCLDAIFDRCDDEPRFEPVAISWCWDPATPWCPIHDWPVVLCEGWSEDEHHLIRRGSGSYSDLARRLITEHRA